MKTNTRDNVSRFLYDCGKVTFAILVVGVLPRSSFVATDLMWGKICRLAFLVIGITVDQRKAQKET